MAGRLHHDCGLALRNCFHADSVAAMSKGQTVVRGLDAIQSEGEKALCINILQAEQPFNGPGRRLRCAAATHPFLPRPLSLGGGGLS